MPHIPRVQHIRQENRSPYFTLRVNRKLHYLGTDQSTAYKKAARLLASAALPSGDPQSVAELIVAYKQEHPDYNADRTRHPWADHSGEIPLDEIGRDHLEKYALHLKRRRLAAATQRKYVWEAHMILKWAHRQGWIDAMPDKAKTPKPAADPQDVDVDTLHAAFEDLPERARASLSFMLAVGCRPSEARLLRWVQVDYRRSVCVLSAHKTAKATGRPRTLFLTPAAVEILKAQSRTSEYVFVSRLGKPYGQGGIILGPTLEDALNARGGGINLFARESVAALLNAAHDDVNYYYTVPEVMQITQQAIVDESYIDAVIELKKFNTVNKSDFCSE